MSRIFENRSMYLFTTFDQLPLPIRSPPPPESAPCSHPMPTYVRTHRSSAFHESFQQRYLGILRQAKVERRLLSRKYSCLAGIQVQRSCVKSCVDVRQNRPCLIKSIHTNVDV